MKTAIWAVSVSWLITFIVCSWWILREQGPNSIGTLAIYMAAAVFGAVYGVSLNWAERKAISVMHAVLSAITTAVGQVLCVGIALAFMVSLGNALHQLMEDMGWRSTARIAWWVLSGAVGGVLGGLVTAAGTRAGRRPAEVRVANADG